MDQQTILRGKTKKKILEENMEKNIHDFGLNSGFLYII